VLATAALWRTSARGHAKLHKTFLASLLRCRPISPKHERPKTIGGDRFSSLVRDEHPSIFRELSQVRRRYQPMAKGPAS
jgi:hypothetical protein